MSTVRHYYATSEPARAHFVRAVQLMKRKHVNGVSVYDRFVLLHKAATDGAHHGPAFLPWHRVFLHLFEREMHAVLETSEYGIPYWDWTSEPLDWRTSPMWKDDFMGPSGDPVPSGPFAAGKWVTHNGGSLVRALGRSARSRVLPDLEQVKGALSQQFYDTEPWTRESPAGFRNVLEGNVGHPRLHAQVHNWVGGTMGRVPTSPDDPVFFLHHANIDRLWAQWQMGRDRGFQPVPGFGRRARPGHNLTDELSGLGRRLFEGLDIARLGYCYDLDPGRHARLRCGLGSWAHVVGRSEAGRRIYASRLYVPLRFRAVPSSVKGFHYLGVEGTDLVLDIEHENRERGARLILWARKSENDADNQLWELDAYDGFWFVIRSRLNGYALTGEEDGDVVMRPRATGTPMDGQLWRVAEE
ncbi:MAG TPA: tyrosinase family protein [Longimicrobium sp.]|nr:tyrosinase family protein [Longimicrobium sp.]